MSSNNDRAPKYIHPFTPSHMNSAFKMLLPHLQRWRSLTVLTDTWEQMHTALARLSSYDAWDAPQLESLTLMRCNEFASYTDFHPAHKRDSQWLPLGRSIILEGQGKPLPLPRLRSLNLTGVHLHWQSLPLLLTPQGTSSPPSLGLQSLVFKYHPRDVRPSTNAFCDILRACPDLRSLSVVVSGPFPDVEDEVAAFLAVPLPHLEHLHLGYTTAHHACHLLRLLCAPNLKSLSLEDATHLANPFEPDAKAILYYLSTGILVITAHPDPSNPLYDMHSFDNIHPPFPRLQDVKMVGVKAPGDAFSLFFRAHSQLQNLDMSRSSTDACRSLLPQPSTSAPTDPPNTFIPCPLLHKLCVRGAYLDIDFIAALPAERAEKGCRRLRHVAVYVDPDLASEGSGSVWDDDESSDGAEEDDDDDEVLSDRDPVDHDMVALDCSSRWGTAVRVYRSPKLKVDELDMDCDYAAGDPYAPGGAFNDPEFDEYYSRRQLWPAASGAA